MNLGKHLFFVFVGILLCFSGTPLLFAEVLGPETDLNKVGEKLELEVEPDGDLHLSYKRGSEIFYLRQLDGQWESGERQVQGSNSNTYNSRWYPKLAVDSHGNAHFAWADPWLRYDYYNSFNASTGGFTGLTIVISDADGGGDTNRCDIAVDKDDAVFVVGQSDWGIDYRKKEFNGNWGPESILFRNVGDEPTFPAIAGSAVNDDMYCVYTMDGWPTPGLQYNRWNGSTWLNPDRPGATGGTCCPNYNNVTVDGNGRPHIVWVIWTNDEFSDMLYIFQRPNGSWSNIQTLISQPDYFHCPQDECTIPQIAVAQNGTVCIVYADGNSNSSKVYYWLKEPGQDYFTGSPKRLTANSSYQNYPALAVYYNTFYAAWSDNRLGGHMYMRTIEVEPLPQELDPPTLLQAEVNNEKVYLAWEQDDPEGIRDYFTVYRQVDGGKVTPLVQTSLLYYTDEDFWYGSTFTYHVVSVDTYGRTSNASNSMNVFFDVPTVTEIGFIILLLGISAIITLWQRRRKTSLVVENE